MVRNGKEMPRFLSGEQRHLVSQNRDSFLSGNPNLALRPSGSRPLVYWLISGLWQARVLCARLFRGINGN